MSSESPVESTTTASESNQFDARAELLRRRLSGRGAGRLRREIPPADRDRPLVLSPGQQQMWFLSRLEPDSPEYLVPIVLRVKGELDLPGLRSAAEQVVARHEILRTRYTLLSGAPVQLVDPAGPLDLRVHDLTDISRADVDDRARSLVAQQAECPFDLTTQWPIRIRLIRLAAEEHLLVVVLHHIACDAWSTVLFAEELSQLYAAVRTGAERALPAVALQYADYAAWQQSPEQVAAQTTHLEYWRDQLAGLQPSALPTDRPRPALRSPEGAVVDFELPAALAKAVRRFAADRQRTPFHVLLAAEHALLARYSGSNDITIGTVVSSRGRPELRELFGYAINSLPIRCRWADGIELGELFDQVADAAVDGMTHAEVPFARLAEALQPERDLSRTPLFQVAFTWHESRSTGYDLPGLVVTPFEEVSSPIARFDLTLQVQDGADGSLHATLEYATSLFDAATVHRMVGHYLTLLTALVERPEQHLDEVSLLTPAEQSIQLAPPRDPGPADPRALPAAFEAQVARTPDAVAITSGDQALSYAELNRRANRIARRLRQLGVGREDLVGVCLDRDLDLMPALIGVLKAGAGYLPLDPINPADRLRYMLRDSGASAVITSARRADLVAGVDRPQLVLDTDEDLLAQAEDNLGLPASPDQLVYAIYTSGSTGQPKGVCLTHRNVLRLLTIADRHYDFDAADVWPLFHSYAFDVSVWEMWGALLHGGRLVMVDGDTARAPEDLLRLLASERVTMLNQTPSAFRSLIAASALAPEIELPALRGIVFAGERLEPTELRGWVDRFGYERPRLLNMYGITETTVHTTFHVLTADDLADGAASIVGFPLDDLAVYLLDAAGQPVPLGVAGEIHVAGPGLARGYLHRPGLTAQRFVPDPFGPAGSRMYRSGDLARRRPDGRLECLGRIDDQVKIRGYRVELGEIQARLLAHPDIADAIVLLRADGPGSAELVGYVVPRVDRPMPDPAELRTLLAQDLPLYMVPAAFVGLTEFPLTANGKLDKRALPAAVGSDRRSGAAFVSPRTALEQSLARVWAAELDLPQVGVFDGFFDIGGDSLRAVALIGALRDAGHDVAVRDMFNAPTVAQLADVINDRPALISGLSLVEPFALIDEADRVLLPVGISDAYPLSQIQLGMALEMTDAGGRGNYHNVTTFRIRDERPYRHDALIAAAATVTARHEALRTSLELDRYSIPLQLVHDRAVLPTDWQDLSDVDPDAADRSIRSFMTRERANRFDLSRPSLMRLFAHDTADDGWWLSITECHPILEGWSHHSMLMELLQEYDRAVDGLEPGWIAQPEARFADFIAAEAVAVADPAARRYWAAVTAEHPAVELPAGWGGHPEADAVSVQAEVAIADLEPALRDFASQSGVSLKSVLLLAYLSVLGQISGLDRFCAGLVCDARPELPGADQVYGMYLNTVPFPVDLSAGTWREAVRQVFRTEGELWGFRRFPLPEIQRLAGRSRLLDIYFNYQDFRQVDLARVDYLASIDDSPTEFGLSVSTRAGFVVFTGAATVFSADGVARLAGWFRVVLAAMVRDPEGSCRQLAAGEAELASALALGRGPERRLAEADLVGLIAEHAARHPGAPAVLGRPGRLAASELDYAALLDGAARLAGRLAEAGVRAGDLVAIRLPRTTDLPIALLAVQFLAAAYLPLDLGWPHARQAAVLADAAPQFLLTDEAGIAFPDVATLSMLELATGLADAPRLPQPSDIHPLELCYVLYTSGSTGRPKGVAVTRGGLVNLLRSVRERVGGEASTEVWLAATSVSFDISGLEFWLPLIGGGRLVLADDSEVGDGVELARLVAERQVTHVQSTPSGWKVLRTAGLLDHPGTARLTGLVGGEALPLDLADALTTGLARIIHVYGPTETTIWSTAGELRRSDGRIDLGPAVDNTTLMVLARDGRPAPAGVPGELAIGGHGLAQGYWQRPDLTADRFVPDPTGPSGSRCYLTGDLVTRFPDGALVFLGRTDDQVKIRGYRIELGDVRTALLSHPAVLDAVVQVRPLGDQPALVAWVQADSASTDGPEVSAAGLRAHLQELLPGYMLPSAYQSVSTWPLTSAGKLDVRALPDPQPVAARTYLAPRTEAERLIVAAWQQALGVAEVGVEDGFFDLGGDSIRAIVLVAAIRKQGFTLTVRDILEHRTVAELAAQLTRDAAGPVTAPAVIAPFALLDPELTKGSLTEQLPAGVVDAYPVSRVQLGMLIEMDLARPDDSDLSDLDQPPARYHNVDTFRIDDGHPVDVAALQAAVGQLVQHHDVLRTGFNLTGYREPIQLVYAEAPSPLAVRDLRGLPAERQQQLLVECAAAERVRPFDLSTPSLIRLTVHLLDATEWQLTYTHSHAIFDGWSYHSSLTELIQRYQAIRDHQEYRFTESSARFADFVAGERQALASTEDRDYWQRVVDEAAPLQLPTGWGGGPDEHASVKAQAELTELLPDLRRLASACQVSLKTVLLAGYLTTLSQLTHELRFTAGLVCDARPELPGADRVLGMHLNTVPIQFVRDRPVSWRALLAALYQQEAELWSHRRFPLPEIQRLAGGARLVDVYFNYQDFGAVDLGQVDRQAVLAEAPTEFALTVTTRPQSVVFTGSAGVFSVDGINRLAQTFRLVLSMMVADPDSSATEPVLAEAEREALLLSGRGRDLEPVASSFVELFQHQVRRTPEAVALSSAGRQWCYRELAAAATGLAGRLRAAGLRPGDLVGVLAERSAGLVVAMLAAQLAEVGYVPLDPSWPDARVAVVLADAAPQLVLVDSTGAERLADSAVSTLELSEPSELDLSTATTGSRPPDPAGVAYVLYTSGSTGKPKGVAITHNSLANLLLSMRHRLGRPSCEERWLAATSVSFDISGLELYLPLISGGRVVLAGAGEVTDPALLLSLISTESVTHLQATPSGWRLLLEAGFAELPLAATATVLVGGEELPPELAGRLARRCARVFNVYGPTETTIWSSSAIVDGLDRGVSLGEPLDNTQLMVLAPDLELAPLGTPGELGIAGAGLAQGYLHRPDLTAERFVPNPFGAPGTRLYRTGDLVCRTLDDRLAFLGRLDEQVKIRGHRIELGEIRAALMADPSVAEAVVLVRSTEGGDRWLVGYVQPAPDQPVDPAAIRQRLAAQLPAYLVPATIVAVTSWPLTSAGKLDRAALPAPTGSAAPRRQGPRDRMEELVAAAWQQALGVEQVGIHDGFFDLGGDSMRAVSLVGALATAGFESSVRMVFEYQTVAEQARYFAERQPDRPAPDAPDAAEALAAALRAAGIDPNGTDLATTSVSELLARLSGTAAAPDPAPAATGSTPTMPLLVAPFALIDDADRALLPDGVVDAYPLSLVQAGMAFEAMQTDPVDDYHRVTSYRVRARFDLAALQRTLTDVIAGHEALRTSIWLSGFSAPLQLVHAVADSAVRSDDLRAAADFEAELGGIMAAERADVFDLGVAPLVRVRAVQESDQAWRLVLAHSHVVLEGWSQHSLLSEILQRYQRILNDPASAGVATAAAEHRSTVRFADFIAAEQAALAAPGDRSYWAELVAGHPVAAVPDAWRGTGDAGPRRGVIELADLSDRLQAFASETRVSVKSVLLTVYLSVLGQVSGLERLSAGVVWDARPELPGADRVLGMHLNTLPFPIERATGSWRELVRQVFRTEAELGEHRRFPLPEIQRLTDGQPAVRTIFTFQDFHQVDTELIDQSANDGEQASSQFELAVSTRGSALVLTGAGRLFSDDGITALAARFRQVLELVLSDPDGSSRQLAAAVGEHDELVALGTGPVREVPAIGVPGLFARCARQDPARIAVTAGDRDLSYGQLYSAAQALAADLHRRGLRAGDRLAVLLPRTADLLIALLAAQLASITYLPLDPSWPDRRLGDILTDAAPQLLLTTPTLAARSAGWHPPVLALDPAAAPAPQAFSGPVPDPAAIAYLLYTSGSTGRPKGVAVTNAGLTNLLLSMREQLSGDPAAESWLAATSVSFDISGLELFLPLIGGGRVVLADADQSGDALALCHLLRNQDITHAQATPSGWRALLAAGLDTVESSCHTALVGGEALPPDLADRLLARFDRVVHVYGPTETTIWSTAGPLDRDSERVSLGAAIANTRLCVLAADDQPAPVGVPGELVIAGVGVAQGYLNRPDLTAAQFVPDPAGPPGSRRYRTGDLVRWDHRDRLCFIGRVDEQVKLRGHRIELGEVRRALLDCAAVLEAQVVVTAVGGEPALVGYVQPTAATEIELTALRNEVANMLPAYMVPSVFVPVAEWPLTSAGKLDLRALPQPTSLPAAEHVEPRTAIESVLVQAWQTGLGVTGIGVHDSFFDLGGDSIRAIVLVSAIRLAGYPLSVRELLEHRTIAELAAHLTDSTAAAPATTARPAPGSPAPFSLLTEAERAALPVGLEDAYPTSQIQLGMLIEMELADAESTALYHNVDAFRVRDRHRFDETAFRAAAAAVVAAHPALRTGFALTEYPRPIQLVQAEVTPHVTVSDLRSLSAQEFERRVQYLTELELSARFEVARPPLMRMQAVLQDERNWTLLLTHAHPILEGWSYHLVLSELLQRYNAILDRQPYRAAGRPGGNYADFIAAELTSLADGADRAYWREVVESHSVLSLPEHWAESTDAPVEGVQVHVPVRDLQPALQQLAGRAEASLKSVLLAAHLKVMSQLTADESFMVGLACDARPDYDRADLVAGMHLNSVPIGYPARAASWRELVGAVFAAEREQRPHLAFPLPEIQRLAGKTRLLEVIFNYIDFHHVDDEQIDLQTSTGAGLTEFPLAVSSRSGYLSLRTDTRYLSRSSAERLASMYRLVLEAMAADPDGDAHASYLPPAERDRLLAEPSRFEVTGGIVDGFTRWVSATPDAVAVVAEDEELTYADLDEQANRLANLLHSRQIGAEQLVGVCLDRNRLLVPTLLGVLKSGAAYLPLDPAQPNLRLRAVMAGVDVAAVLTERRYAEQVRAATDVPMLVLEDLADRLAMQAIDPVPMNTDPANLAYVIHTSGSTGRPNGVAVSHGSVLRLFAATEERCAIQDRQNWALTHSYAFDVSVWEIWGPLLHGNRVIVVPVEVARNADELIDVLVTHQVDVLTISPSAFTAMVAAVSAGDRRMDELKLRSVFFGGEKQDGAALQPWVDRFGLDSPELVNVYGPTEATVQVTHHRIGPADLDAQTGIQLGRALSDTVVRVLDRHAQLVPVGVVGELYLGGDALARGYASRPELTADRFVPDQFGRPGSRLYRTGDLARILPGGGLDFIGRADDQVKVRGYRIEPGEIRAALNQHPAIADSAVIVDQTAPGGARIVGYLVLSPGATEPSRAELVQHCAAVLPDYMVPDTCLVLDRLPLTANTKLDVGALPKPGWSELGSDRPFVAPVGAAETAIAQVWAEALGLARISVEDSFFDVGGDSIRAVSLAGALRQAGFDVNVRDIFALRSVRNVAAAAVVVAESIVDAEPVRRFALIADDDRRRLPEGTVDAYPMAQAQLGMVVEMLADSTVNRYVNSNVFRVRDDGPLDLSALRTAVATVVDRHEILRTSFALTGYDGPLQLVWAEAAAEVRVVTLRSDADGSQQDLAEFLAGERRTGFDIAVPGLIRVAALVAPGGWWLGVTQCHAITEGWSHHSLVMELLDEYRLAKQGETREVTPVDVRYADFVAAELAALADPAEQEFWSNTTTAYPPLRLPDTWAEPDAAIEPVLVRVPFADILGPLEELARAANASMKAVLHTVHLMVMSRLTAQPSFAGGLGCDARPERLGADRVLGMHLNTVPFGFDRPAGACWRDVVADVFAREVQLWPHRRLPLPTIQRLAPDLAAGHNLIDVVFNYQDYRNVIDTEVLDIDASGGAGASEFALIVTTLNGNLSLSSNTGVLSRPAAERLAEMYRTVLLALATDPSGRAEVQLTPADELQLRGWAGDPAAHEIRTITQLFADQVVRAPAAIAVADGRQSLSYLELAGRAEQLADRLRAHAVSPGAVVAVCLARSAVLPAVLLGVLRTGAAYMCIDADYPTDRLRFMLADSGATALVTDPANAGLFGSWDGPVLLFDDDATDPRPAFSVTEAMSWLTADESVAATANVMYTSGSTGAPKASVICHRGIVRLVRGQAELRSAPGDVVGQAASVSFDAATWEIWSALLNGARLEVVDRDTTLDPQALAATLRERRINLLFLTTTLFNLIARAVPDAFAGLDRVIFGGEAADAGALRSVLRSAAPAQLVNGYGPTENSAFSTVHVITTMADLDQHHSVPIGRPIEGTEVFVLDDELSLVPAGVLGELCVGGAGLSEGYLARPGLTADRFVPHPFSLRGERLYRTGDLARWLPDGVLEFAGRTDNQVKLRGNRLELGEIEGALRAHPAVADACVMLREDQPGRPQLAAYVVSAAGAARPVAELRARLAESLPEVMVPASYTEIRQIPLLVNGKIDQSALPVPSPQAFVAGAELQAPRTPVEAELARIWGAVLGLEQVGVNRGFFDLGGDSIRAVSLVGELKEAGFDVSVSDVFTARTIEKLAELCADRPAPAMQFVLPFELVEAEDAALLPAGLVDAYPLSQLQTGMLVELLSDQERNNYQHTTSFRITDGHRFDLASMQRAVRIVVSRHEPLRTSIDLQTFSVPMQLVHAEADMIVRFHDLRGLDLGRSHRRMEQISRAEQADLLDIAVPCLIRLAVAEDDAGWRMFLTLNHTILEGWGHYTLWMELLTTYRALRAGDPAPVVEQPRVRFADAVAAELAAVASPVHRDYWRGVVSDHPRFSLPPAWAEDHADGASIAVSMSLHDLTAQLREIAKTLEVSVKSVLLAAHLKVLSQLTREGSFTSGLVCDTRPELTGGDRIYGMYLNTLPIVHRGGARTWRQLINQTFAAELELWTHRRFPLPAVQQFVAAGRSGGNRRVIDVFFNYLDFRQIDTELMDLGSTIREGSTEFPLAVTTMAGELGLLTKDSVMGRDRLQALAATYRMVLEAMIADLDGDAQAVLLAPADEALVTQVRTGPTRRFELGWTHERFTALARSQPEATAIRDAAAVHSYAAVNARANQIAHRLIAAGLRRDEFVGVLLPRGSEQLTAILAVLKAGGAYLPLDPAHPAERHRHQLADLAVPVLLTDTDLAGRAARFSGTVVCLDVESLADQPTVDPARPVGPDNLAYAIYTSGSTGTPKAVLITHAGLANYLNWAEGCYAAEAEHGAAMFGSIAYDLAIPSFLLPLVTGRDVTVVGDERQALSSLLRAGDRYQLAKFTPAHLDIVCAELTEAGAAPVDNVGVLVVGGEQLLADKVRAWRRVLPNARVINEYGPTETVVGCIVEDVALDDADTGPVPIGRPIANTSAYVVDSRLQPAPVGVAGELCLGGAGLARGYHGRPDLTAERFVPDPFGEPGARMYRTGDLARLRPDGGLEFIGRSDNQVKIRGYRVELGEIEAVLLSLPEIQDAAVAVREDRPGERRLIGYLVPADGGRLDTAAISTRLASLLPVHMIPGALLSLAELPLASSGKLDRAALAELAAAGAAATDHFVAPRTGTERALADLWSAHLGVSRVGVHDSFFGLGGDSIMLLPLVTAAGRQGLPITLRLLYEHETLAELASALDAVDRPVPPPSEPADAAALAAALELVMANQQSLGLRVSTTSVPLEMPLPLLDEHRVPGVSFAVVQGGELVQVGAAGVVRADGGPVSPDTVFPAGSISKHVSVLAALRLVREGRFDLATDIGELLTSWSPPTWQGHPVPITVAQLLRFTSGLGHPATDPGDHSYAPAEPLPSVVEVLRGTGPAKTPPVELLGEPGTVFVKNNVGYTVLQQLLEDVSGLDFAQLMQSLVLGPLAMTASSYRYEALAERHDVALGHDEHGVVLPVPPRYPDLAATGLWTTAADLARVGIEIRRAARGLPSVLLDAELTEQLLNVVEPARYYGLGTVSDRSSGDIEYGHTGQIPGFRALTMSQLQSGSGVVVMTNGDSGRAILKHLLAEVRRREGDVTVGQLTELWERGSVNPEATD